MTVYSRQSASVRLTKPAISSENVNRLKSRAAAADLMTHWMVPMVFPIVQANARVPRLRGTCVTGHFTAGVSALDAVADREFTEARRHPRFKLEVDVQVYPRNAGVVRGHSVDISESGLSAMLREEVPVGEVVRLSFALPAGDVEVHAFVRQRSAFRYGFQFMEASAAQALINRTCRQLAVEQSISRRPAE